MLKFPKTIRHHIAKNFLPPSKQNTGGRLTWILRPIHTQEGSVAIITTFMDNKYLCPWFKEMGGGDRWGPQREEDSFDIGEGSIALAWVDKNIFPIQRYLKATCDFLPPPTCMSSFFWTIHSTSNGWTLRFHFKTFAPSLPFSTCSSTQYLMLIMFEFYHVLALRWATLFQTRFKLPHPSITSLP